MAANDGVTRSPQIIGQIPFHLGRSGVGHRVQVCVKCWQQLKAETFNERGAFDSSFVVLETLFWHEARQADIDDRFLWIASGVAGENLSNVGCCRSKKHNIHVVMVARGGLGANFPECAPLQGAWFRFHGQSYHLLTSRYSARKCPRDAFLAMVLVSVGLPGPVECLLPN